MARKINPLYLLVAVIAAPAFFGANSGTFRSAEAETETAKPELSAPRAIAAKQGVQAAGSGPRSVTLRMEADGHYWATAKVNNAQVRFLVDTGASVIALTEADARRAGLNVKSLPKVARMSTANGDIMASVATLKRVRVGNVEVNDVRAVVIEDGLSTSLLGMSFLSELKSWQMTPAGLVLKQ